MLNVDIGWFCTNFIAFEVGVILSISSRRFTLNNKIPFLYFLDEATLCFLTQAAVKIEKVYGKYGRSSVEANFSKQFYGRIKDIGALKKLPEYRTDVEFSLFFLSVFFCCILPKECLCPYL